MARNKTAKSGAIENLFDLVRQARPDAIAMGTGSSGLLG